MATVTLHGNPFSTNGDLPAVGNQAPGFKLVGADLKDVAPSAYTGKRKVLNIFPSIDTPTCAMSVRQFNQRAASLDHRSEEHTSELQSLMRISYAVFCLKKQKKQNILT